MTELVVRQHDNTAIVTPTSPASAVVPTATGAMRLVEWAEEAQAASHLARALCETPFAGSWKGDPDGATAAILKGAEIGLTPVTALSAFDNIQGTPAPKAITLRALVQGHGHDLEIIEETDQRAVARYRRNGRGDWLTTTFTIDNARTMGLLTKSNWKNQPGTMLIARVTSKAARLVASDVILGIGYSAEEIRDQDPSERTLPSLAAAGGEEPRGLAAALHQQDTAAADEAPAEDRSPAEEEPITDHTRRQMFALFGQKGIAGVEQLAGINHITGKQYESRGDLTESDALEVIRVLQTRPDAVPSDEPAVEDVPEGADQ